MPRLVDMIAMQKIFTPEDRASFVAGVSALFSVEKMSEFLKVKKLTGIVRSALNEYRLAIEPFANLELESLSPVWVKEVRSKVGLIFDSLIVSMKQLQDLMILKDKEPLFSKDSFEVLSERFIGIRSQARGLRRGFSCQESLI